MYPFLQKNAVPTTAVSQWENEGLISRHGRIHAESIGTMQPFETVYVSIQTIIFSYEASSAVCFGACVLLHIDVCA